MIRKVWQGWKYTGVKRVVWELTPAAIIWSVWYIRNEVYFDNKVFNWTELLELIKWRIAFWAKSKEVARHLSFYDLLFNIQAIGC